MRLKLIVGIVALFCCAANAAPKPAGVSASELKNWTIVVAADALPSEKFAAEEFRALFKQCVGADLKIVDTAPKKRAILIGKGAQRKTKPAAKGAAPDLGDEGLAITVTRKTISITGGQPRGTLYGVYEFFERYFGVRFLTFDDTHIPSDAATRVVPCESFTYTPPLSFRYSYYTENHEHHDFATRLRINTVSSEEKLGGVTPQSLINHSLFKWVHPDKYGKSHPEYFALVDGERKLEVGGGGPEVCVTNPEVLDIVTQGVLDDLAKSPGVKNISVSQNDNDQYCHCPNCEAINQREGTPMGSHLAFVNAVAERVEKKYPDVKIGTLAYWYTRKAPKTITPRKNIQIQLCSIECCTLHPINDPNCPKNREFCQDMMVWKSICNDIWIWNYNTNFANYDLPFPNLRVISPNIRFFVENNAKGIFMQANAGGNAGEMSDLRNYVMSRCLWNPSLDGAALVDEFCTLHYGKAAKPILAYLAMLHDNANAKGVHPGCFPKPEEVGLTPEIAQKSLAYFNEALALEDNDMVRKRVEKASICAYKAMLEMAPSTWNYADGHCSQTPSPEAKGVPNRYVELCTTYGMSSIAEGKSSEPYFKEIKSRETGYKAVCLENNSWRVIALPEQSGKVVSLYNKAAKRELLSAMTHSDILLGTHDDPVINGIAKDTPLRFTASVNGPNLTLESAPVDGIALVRCIGLDAKHPDVIRFDSELINRGSNTVICQFKAHPEFNAVSRTNNADVVVGEVRSGGVWTQFNKNWRTERARDLDMLKRGKDGVFAFFSREAQFGVQVEYQLKEVHRPNMWWYPEGGQISLELFSPVKDLKPGESLKLNYLFRYLSAEPK